MSNIRNLPALKPSEIQGMATALDVITNPSVQERFIGIFNYTHGNNRGETVYHSECIHFIKQITEKKLLDCEKMSIYTTFMDVAIRNLSFDPKAKLCYLMSRNVNVGTKDKPVWTKQMVVEISPYGELAQRIEQGHIADADEPRIVYEGDEYKRWSDDEGVHVTHTPANDSTGKKILFAYIRYSLPNGRRKTFALDLVDMDRFAKASARQNARGNAEGKANELYTSFDGQPDPGFFMAKCIKHAFKSMPKIKIGRTAILESEKIVDTITDTDLLGFDENLVPAANDSVEFTEVPETNPESSDNPTVNEDF